MAKIIPVNVLSRNRWLSDYRENLKQSYGRNLLDQFRERRWKLGKPHVM